MQLFEVQEKKIPSFQFLLCAMVLTASAYDLIINAIVQVRCLVLRLLRHLCKKISSVDESMFRNLGLFGQLSVAYKACEMSFIESWGIPKGGVKRPFEFPIRSGGAGR
jgi:hypothetical protein